MSKEKHLQGKKGEIPGGKDLPTTEQEKLRYRETRKEYTKTVTKAKIQSWRDFVIGKENKEPWGIAYKTVSGKLGGEETVSTLQTLQRDTPDWRSTAAAMLSDLLPDD